jgi:4-hydroxy-4-methyl-2-oxoglutarate aldolase
MNNGAAPECGLANRLKAFGSATLHEAQDQKGAMSPAIRPLDPSLRLAGPAFTIETKPGDNLVIHFALTLAKAGDVLVINANAYEGAGLWGEILTRAAMQRGIAGLVIDGAVRDSQPILDMHFPVFSRGLSINAAQKNQPGRIDVPIVCGGVGVEPGDWVVGDRDGLVVIARESLQAVLAGAEVRETAEAGLRAAIQQGRSTVELLGLQESLVRVGLRSASLAGAKRDRRG